MECPQCGAPIKAGSATTCEYCGSVLVRLAAQDVLVDHFPERTASGVEHTAFVFPGLEENLQKAAVAFRTRHPDVADYVRDGSIEVVRTDHHPYILNILRPGSAETVIQVVPAWWIAYLRQNDFGFAVHLTFPPEDREAYDRFLRLAECSLFVREDYPGCPCFDINLGTEVRRASTFISYVLTEVYQFAESTRLGYEFFDVYG
jgi:hypothetical protein